MFCLFFWVFEAFVFGVVIHFAFVNGVDEDKEFTLDAHISLHFDETFYKHFVVCLFHFGAPFDGRQGREVECFANVGVPFFGNPRGAFQRNSALVCHHVEATIRDQLCFVLEQGEPVRFGHDGGGSNGTNARYRPNFGNLATDDGAPFNLDGDFYNISAAKLSRLITLTRQHGART